jgi:hypothetical protein
VDGEVTSLLSARTTECSARRPPVIWEQGVSIQGDAYWQAKRRYGQDVVLKWIGPSGTKNTHATWKRLYTALTAATK